MKNIILPLIASLLFASCETPNYRRTSVKCKIVSQTPIQDWHLALHPETKWHIITECGDTFNLAKKIKGDSVEFIYLTREKN